MREYSVNCMYFFFFKQKTAYEIKECDWSSDVCSSDLETHLNKKINIKFTDRRKGDPAKLFANSQKAKKILNWECKHSDLKTIIKSAIKWHKIKK